MKRLLLYVLTTLFLILVVGCAKDQVTPNVEEQNSSEKTVENSNEMLDKVEDPKIKRDSASSDTKEQHSDQDPSDHNQVSKKDNKKRPQTNDDEGNSNKSTTNEHPTTKSTGDKGETKKSSTKEKQQSNSNKKKPKKDAKDISKDTKSPDEQDESSEEDKKESDEEEQTQEETKSQTQQVTISIETGAVKGTILSPTKVKINDGDTVLDVTQRIVKEKSIQISVRGSDATAYVEGIDNLYEFDEGPLSGWTVQVDGKSIDKSAGVFSIKPNQTITWRYTTNYLEDNKNKE
ncbi:DUF4430 domain-containing protein [Salinibacillus xinjiangensis]|uniref:DUF4430 domain-containing protein n=1 Tax=Salinibacillus xinjiangensis TaxID=1229268 RepID=A0A6G1X4B8_9BACI|nr:DUF4430 domain-containing protein [Salinibacillus xinjiangensis]MRG85769.1 DUF4430 domain-containing protein [Salinibacillus xinjiangensis]